MEKSVRKIVLDKGHVDLMDHMGSDLTVCNAARVSFNKESEWEIDTDAMKRLNESGSDYRKEDLRKLSDKDQKLLAYLAKYGHWTPFAHPQITLRIKAPISIRTQFFKHKVGFCLSGDTNITFIRKTNKQRADGKNKSGGVWYRTIESLYEEWMRETPHSRFDEVYGRRKNISKQIIRTLNTESGVFEESHIVDIICNGKKEVFEIVTKDGKKLKMTRDHRLYTKHGWMSLDDAVGLENRNGHWCMTKVCHVGTNGVKYAGTGKYQDYSWLKAKKEIGYSVQDMADEAGCSYHTIRKWLKIHNLKFDQLKSLCSHGDTPWNKGTKGAITWTDEQKKQQSNRLLHHHKTKPSTRQNTTWRQGVNRWTSQIAHQIHKMYNWTCQLCGERGKKLHCHHIIPVSINEDLAKDRNNLVTVCADCHVKIHKSTKTEELFADKFRSQDTKKTEWKRRGYKSGLKVHFTEIISISYKGEETVYDLTVDHPSHNFIANGLVVHNCENEISRRYVTFEPEIYIPRWRGKPTGGAKQGSDTFIEEDFFMDKSYKETIEHCLKTYESLISDGIAPEQARFVLPQGTYTEWYWTGSLSAYARFFKQRIDDHAQWEIRQYADVIGQLIEPLFPYSWKVLTTKQ